MIVNALAKSSYKLAAVAGVLMTLLSSAHASITGGTVTGGSAQADGGTFVKLTTPLSNPYGAPSSVGDDTYQSPDLYGFDEIETYVLTAPLTVDLGASPIPAGTVVTSHYVFFDPGPLETITGTVEFSSDILGVITTRGNLIASNYLGDPSVNYLDPILVGLEPTNTVWISGPREISIDTRAVTPGDYIRVITVAVPEPATWSLMIGAFACLGLVRRRQLARV